MPSNIDESLLTAARRVANDAGDREEMRVAREELGELAP
jgi:hypothetical protein